MNKVKVLFFAADPILGRPDGVPLEIADEMRRIQELVNKARHGHRLHFEAHGAARADDMLDFLENTDARIVHFSGHCGPHGLGFVGRDGQSPHYVNAEALAQLFKQYEGPVRLVVLAACTSQKEAQAIADIVGCAIGTTNPITDDAATIFNSRFYQGLANGESVQKAFEKGRMALQVHRIPEAQHPQIYLGKRPRAARLVLVKTLPRVRPRWLALPATAAAVTAGVIIIDTRFPPELTASDLACGSVSATAIQPFASRGAVSPAAAAPVGPVKDVANGKAFYHDRNYAAAATAFERAANAGDGEAMGCLGYMYLNGRGLDTAATIGFKLVHAAASEKRNVHAMYALANAYLAGQGTVARTHLARGWFENAAELHFPEAMRSLGDLAAQELNVEGYREALDWYRKAEAAGSLDAKVDLGAMYEYGRGVPRDPRHAFRLYWAAAQAQSSRGMLAVGRSYQSGVGVAQDYARAKAWYLLASRAGSAEAMNAIGYLYDNGFGVRKSHRAAVRWYRRAEKAGSVIAQGNLGRFAKD